MTAPGERQSTQIPAPLVFLSHAGADIESAKELRRLLGGQPGIQVWLDAEQLKPGDLWQAKIEEALQQASAFLVYVGRGGVQGYVDFEVRVALDRSIKDKSFRLIPVLGPGANPDLLPPFLKQYQWQDLREGLREGSDLRDLVAILKGKEVKSLEVVLPSPFLGLKPFEEGDSVLFYGRDKETRQLLDRLRADNFLAVVGDSGSGKSSLVRAGLLPALRRGRFHDGTSWIGSWRMATVRPGGDPFSELAEALPDLGEMEETERLRFVDEAKRLLADGNGGLRSAIAALVPEGSHVLLVVDQFEELFTLSRDMKERNRFVDCLLGSASSKGARPVHVVITLRADFYSHCFQHPALPKRIANNQFPVGRMDREQMREVIEKPLSYVRAKAEPGLVDALLDEAGDEPGNLPLLAHALLELWERSDRKTLTHRAYEDIGRLSGALGNYAEGVYLSGLPETADRDLTRRIFLALTQVGEGAPDTRRRQRKTDLLALGDDDEATARLLTVLSKSRLISVSGRVSPEPESTDEWVEVAHEALIRKWERLKKWIDEGRESLRLERWILQAAEEWEARGRDPTLLLRARPAEVEKWFKENRAHLAARILDFVVASFAARKKESRRRSLLRFALAALALGTSAAFIWGYLSRRQATTSYRNFQLADQVVQQMLTIVDSEEMDDIPQVGALRAELLDKAGLVYKEFQARESNDPRLRMQNALATRRLADIYRQLKQNKEAESAYQLAIARFSKLAEEFPQDSLYQQELANCYNWLGESLRDHDRPAAKRAYDQALVLQESLVAKFPRQAQCQRDLARTANNRGIVLAALGSTEPALRDFERAIESYQALRDSDRSQTFRNDCTQGLAWSYNNLGKLLDAQGRRENAQANYQRAIDLAQELSSREPGQRQYQRELATYYNNLANLHYQAGQLQQANDLSHRSLDLLQQLAAPAPLLSGEVANAYNTLGAILDSRKLTAAAAEAFEKAITIFERLEGQYTDFSKEPLLEERFGNSLLGRGKLHFDGRQFADANRQLCRAVSYHRDQTCLDADYWHLARSLHSSHHLQAATLASDLSRDLPDAMNPLTAAKMMIHCNDLTPGHSTKQERFQVRAIELLQEAAAKGTLTLRDLAASEFDEIRQREDFQKLLAAVRQSQRTS